MSDSDDTDALLLVPPDFFYIHSDSEDNLFCDVSRTQNPELERMDFSDLIDHVSELENRVHLIEHKDSLTPYCCRSVYGQFLDHSVDALHSGSCILHHSTVDMSATPVKNRLALSLTSSPSGGCLTYQHQPLDCSIQSDSVIKHRLSEDVKPRAEVTARIMEPKTQNEVALSHQGIGNVGSAITETAGLNSPEEYAAPLVTNCKQDLMSEIDDFLNSIKKKQPEGAEENNFIFSDQWQRNFESSSFPFFAHSQTFPSVKQFDAQNTERKGLALSDVGRLLDEVGTIQTGIMHTLHEINKPLAGKSEPLRTSQSMPKLDFFEPSNKPQSSLLISAIGAKANENTSDNSEAGCQETECSTTLTENTANANYESTFNRSDLKSARRKLDLSSEFTPSSNLVIKTTDVSNGPVVVEFAASSSNTNLASCMSGSASTSQAPLTLRNTPLPNRQSSSSDVAESSSHLQNYSHFPQLDHAAVVNTNGGSTFSTHTYPPLTSGRARSIAVGSSVLHAQSLMQAVPLCAPGEIRQGEASQSSSPTKALRSCNINNAASGEHKIQEPMKLSYGNDPVTTMRATQGSRNLLSLSELWIGDELSGSHKDDMMNPVRKLEEERYRRQHCERLIRQLQSRLLEEQQKVAVAVEVDSAKDRAILHLQASWRQLVSHWRELEEQRNSVTNTLHLERESFQHDLAQTQQRVKHLEREVSRMLDVTQDYKKKSETLSRDSEQSKRQHELELQKAATKVQQLEQALSSASEALKESNAKEEELVSQLLSAKQNVEKEKKAKETVLRELEQTRATLARLEGELLALKEENVSLQIKLKEEKNRNSLLDKQKKVLQAALDDIKKREKSGREEVRLAGEKLERIKMELRDHYQQQVEKVVQEKMREFQAQLDADEVSMRNELQQRERAVTELAAQQIKQIADKHEVEMRLIGEKHREELHLLRIQLSQSMQKVADLQTALAQLRSHRSQVAERLHAIMEAQWRESVRVIAGNSSPLHPSKLGTSEQAWEVPPLPLLGLDSGSSSTDSIPFGKDGQLTHRIKTGLLQQVASASQLDREDELKKYISMLLECKPGNPVGELSEIPTSECGHIPARTQQEYLGVRMESQDDHCAVQGQVTHLNSAKSGSVSSIQESQAGKPPWK